MNSTEARFKGLGVVRDSRGLIRANNYEQLERCFQLELLQLIQLDGGITAESYPNPDPRFIQET